jgi:hypothetical protein
VGSPRVYQDESRSGIRPLERQVLRLFGIAEFLSLTIGHAGLADHQSGAHA